MRDARAQAIRADLRTAESRRDRVREHASADVHLFGSKAIAAHLGVSQSTVLKMIHSGEVPAYLVGGRLQISRRMLDAWLLYKQLEALADLVGSRAAPE